MDQNTSVARATLLLVDDDDQVRGLMRAMLASEPVDILEASTGGEGLRIGESSQVPIDILLTDMLLPELSGYDLAVALRDRFPAMQIIMVTGYIEGEIVQRGVEELGAAFLDKPFAASDLCNLVSKALPVRKASSPG